MSPRDALDIQQSDISNQILEMLDLRNETRRRSSSICPVMPITRFSSRFWLWMLIDVPPI
jgi:hypothetical protein